MSPPLARVALAVAFAVGGLSCAHIRIELEAAAVDVEPTGGGRRLPPEDPLVQAAYGLSLQGVETPMRECAQAKPHPAEGKAKLLVRVDPSGGIDQVNAEASSGMEELVRCIEGAVRSVHFPRSDRVHTLRLETRFSKAD